MEVYQALISTLEQQNQLITNLLALGAEKCSMIREADTVFAIAKQEQEIVKELQELEVERMSLFDVVASGQTLVEWLEKTNDQKLSELTGSLRKNTVALESLNATNEQLLHESLAFVQYSLSLIVDTGPKIYARQGPTTSSRSFFDRKV